MYSDVHRYFLQYMMQKSYVDVDTSIKFCQKYSDAVLNFNSLKELIGDINSKIQYQDLCIKIGKNEINGENNVVFVNSLKNCSDVYGSSFDKHEIQFFFRVVKEIIELSEEKSISVMLYLNATHGLPLTKDRAEELLSTWVEEGYFILYDNKITFGLRFTYEFATILATEWADFVIKCNLCTDIVFLGESCKSCGVKMHIYCLRKYLQRQANCPNCKNKWDEKETQESEGEQSLSNKKLCT